MSEPVNQFEDLVAERAEHYPTWREVREGRLNERKYPHCPIPSETLRERIRRIPYAVKDAWWHRPWVRLKWKRERMRQGWSEYDWWGIDKHFAEMIAGVARKYRDEGHGYPTMFDDDGESLAEVFAVEKWRSILTEMADGFDGYAKETLAYDAPAFQRALKLFVEYFGALWD